MKPTANEHYQQTLQWKQPERPVLLSWTRRVRDYDLFLMEGFFIVISLLLIGMCTLIYFMFVKFELVYDESSLIPVMLLFCLLEPVFFISTRPQKTYVYRLTEQGYEEQSFNDIERWKVAVIVVGIALTLILVIVSIKFPTAALGLLVGPPLMGVMYYRMFASQAYWDYQKDFTHCSLGWKTTTFTKIQVYRQRAVIRLFGLLDKIDPTTNKPFEHWLEIYPTKDNLDEVINFIKAHTQDLPYTESYFFISK